MRPGARLQAAIEILADVDARKRPAAEATKDWMLAHRFAGSKDRAEIGDLVFGALRWRASSAYRFGSDTPRAWVFGAVRWGFDWTPDALSEALTHPHAPDGPSPHELATIGEAHPAARLDSAPHWVLGDYPEWLDAEMAAAFGDERRGEGRALAAPAPLDLRANALKTTSEKLLTALAESPRLSQPPSPCPFAPHGVRVPWAEGRTFPWATEQAFQKGWFEVQDEGSQLAAAAAAARPGDQVADICAGGGGKTLALAAAMANKGQIYAFDVDGRRLAPLHERLMRAGVRNAQIRAPARGRDVLEDLHGRMDLVFVDAPCSGSGTWRRAPDTKWRLKPAALETRCAEQQEALALAAPLVKSGGRLAYVTCSVLPAENEVAVARFLATRPEFSETIVEPPAPAWRRPHGWQLTPAKTGCDGFYFALLTRS